MTQARAVITDDQIRHYELSYSSKFDVLIRTV
jgi:hypothetical protein